MMPAELRHELFTLTHPADWTIEAYEGAAAVVVSPAPDGAFRANVVVTIIDSSAAIENASLAALAAAGEQHPGALVVSCSVWPHQEQPGREIRFTYPAGESDQVDVVKWVWATGRHHIHLSASAAPYQSPVLDETFSWMASQLWIEESA